jgi:hypothetical protein
MNEHKKCYLFYLVMQSDWRRLAVCLAGFMVVKLVITRRIGNPSESPRRKGTAH